MAGTDTDQIAQDAAWLAHRFDPSSGKVQFVHVPRARHAEIPFLTDEYIGPAAPHAARPLHEAAATAPAGKLHFLFHSAFCCSTLLVRALDRPGIAMGLSEPVILNDISGWRHRERPEGRRIAEVTAGALQLLARPWAPGEAVVIKPSNLLNPLAPALLSLRPESRAILLHAPLSDFLGSVARKAMWGRLWVRDLLVKLLREGMPDLGIEGDEWLKLTDIQVAAVGWLAQHAGFHKLAAAHPTRVRTLNSEDLMAHPARTISAAARLYGLPITEAQAAEIATGPAFTLDSKTGRPFTAQDRAADRDKGLALHAAEIDMVRAWAEKLAAGAGIAMTLPGALQ